MNKAHHDRKDMKIIKGKIEEFDHKIDVLDWTVFNKVKNSSENNGKSKTKDAFEEIYETLAEVKSEIKKLGEIQKFESQLRLDSVNEINEQIKKFIKLGDDLREKHLLMMNDFNDIEVHINEFQDQLSTGILY